MTAHRSASVVEAFVRHAEETPEKTCLRFEGELWTYDRLRGQADDWAAALKAWSLKPGERVALFLGTVRTFWQPTWVLTWRAG
jgi:acyl-CoA synthetase (AMP-forming)/AMP-acid ligase II